jgi:hypothetical protein
VLGDIHGNLPDLDFFRRILWPAGPDAAAGSIEHIRCDHPFVFCTKTLLCLRSIDKLWDGYMGRYMIMLFSAGDFLFLGDFVDRGMESLPVVAYVM